MVGSQNYSILVGRVRFGPLIKTAKNAMQFKAQFYSYAIK